MARAEELTNWLEDVSRLAGEIPKARELLARFLEIDVGTDNVLAGVGVAVGAAPPPVRVGLDPFVVDASRLASLRSRLSRHRVHVSDVVELRSGHPSYVVSSSLSSVVGAPTAVSSLRFDAFRRLQKIIEPDKWPDKYGMPAPTLFPPALVRSSLGMLLTDRQIGERVAALETWLNRAVMCAEVMDEETIRAVAELLRVDLEAGGEEKKKVVKFSEVAGGGTHEHEQRERPASHHFESQSLNDMMAEKMNRMSLSEERLVNLPSSSVHAVKEGGGR